MSSSSAHSFVGLTSNLWDWCCVGLSGFNYSRQTQPQGFGPQWWSLLGKKIISQQHCTLFLRKEAPQKRNNLLEFLWFGKISCTCSQLLEESQSEIFQGLPAAYNCTSSCISRDAQRLLRAWTGLRTVVQAQVSSKTLLCSVILSHVQFSPSHPGQEKVRVAC